MRLVDFVNSQLHERTTLTWVGAPPDAHWFVPDLLDGVELVAGAEKLGECRGDALDARSLVVLVGSVSDEPADWEAVLGGSPEGLRAVLVLPWSLRAEADDSLDRALASHGWQVLFVVELDDAFEYGACTAVSVVRAPAITTEQAQLHDFPLRSADLRLSALEAAAADLSRRLHAAEQKVQQVQDEKAETAAELVAARQELRALRRSASMQIGIGITEAVRNPRAGVPQLPSRLRKARASMRQQRQVPAAVAAPPPAAKTPTGSLWTGRMRTFPLAMPARPTEFPGPSRADNLEFHVPYPLFIPRRLQRDGLAGYEPETLAWFLALCDHAGPGEVWDVGANVGLFALLARAYTDRPVIGFEPTPDLTRWARRIAVANDLDFPMRQVAATDSVGTATFFLSDSTDSSNSLAAGFRASSAQLEVLTLPLDEYAAREGSFPAVIKVDTETTEPAVLRGAQDVLAKHRPWLLCEVLKGTDASAIEAQLAPLDYQFFHVTEELPLRRTDALVGDLTGEFFMYLLAPEPPDDLLWQRVAAWRKAIAACLPLTPPT